LYSYIQRTWTLEVLVVVDGIWEHGSLLTQLFVVVLQQSVGQHASLVVWVQYWFSWVSFGLDIVKELNR